MLNFLFWNTAKNDVNAALSKMVKSNTINIILLAESASSGNDLRVRLNKESGREFSMPLCNSSKIVFLTDFPPQFCSPVIEGNRFTIQAVQLPGKEEFLLVAAHLPSKRDMSQESQQFECFKLASDIRLAEIRRNHKRTVLVGDFNMNPFEAGMVAAGGMHGVMSREIASRKSRVVQGNEYDFFYNPMWSHFGDFPKGPSGTIFYERAEDVCFFWGMFDQVLVRPDLIDRFDSASLRVLTDADDSCLICPKGRPLKEISDHLPLVFSIKP